MSDYSWELASEETLAAMRDRCELEGHNYENCATLCFNVYQRCKWCGKSA